LSPVSPMPILTLLGFFCWCPVFCWLSWKNYAAIRADRWTNRFNLILALCTLVAWFGSASFFYNRTWERWVWSEPAASPSIAVAGVEPSLQVGGNVLSPNGSLWTMDQI